MDWEYKLKVLVLWLMVIGFSVAVFIIVRDDLKNLDDAKVERLAMGGSYSYTRSGKGCTYESN